MSDINLLAASTKTTLLEIAKQANALGAGLQNAAPLESLEAPNDSVQYLLKVSESMMKIVKEFDQFLTHGNP